MERLESTAFTVSIPKEGVPVMIGIAEGIAGRGGAGIELDMPCGAGMEEGKAEGEASLSAVFTIRARPPTS